MSSKRHSHDQRTSAIRRFNRFYTRQIGVLQEGWARSDFSLAEARVLYELAQREYPTATDLVRDLKLDAGYLSRMLTSLQKRGLIARHTSEVDARQSVLSLTKRGHEAFAALDRQAQDDAGTMIERLSPPEQRRLVEAMRTIEQVLGPTPTQHAIVIRTHEAGDMGWMVERHGALYAREHRWNGEFEALVARIAAEFLEQFDPSGERCWIAELDGVPVGSIMLVRKSKTVGQLRLLLVEPQARGLGIGRRLIAECLRFARQAGYKKVVLWTQEGLDAARALYEEAGFELIGREPNHRFGHDLVAQTWALTLV